jgi:hypothetical protein
MSLLITPSLISAIDWVNNCPPSWREKADKDLLNQLGRVWEEGPHYALDLGKKFEDMVYLYADREPVDKGSEHFKWFVEKCKHGRFQKKTRKIIKCGDYEFCLYGKMDAWWPNIIRDIKTTSNWKGPQKYLDSFQHKMYCFNERIADFEYLVAEFKELSEEDQKEGKIAPIIAHHCVTYHVDDFDALDKEVYERVMGAHAFLFGNKELYELYTHKFTQF